MDLVRITRSTVIDAPIEAVWTVLRDFNSHADWHPAIAESRIEDGAPADQIGCVRAFRLHDGTALREQLLALSDRDHRLTYCILESDVGLHRYVAQLSLRPVTDGRRTFWHWQSTFAPPAGRAAELADLVGRGVYEAGFDGLARWLKTGVASGSHQRAELGTLPDGIPGIAVRLRARGGADGLQTGDAEARAPGPGEVRLRQTAIGVNYIDVYVRTGLYEDLVRLGDVPGFEAAGVVLDTGPGVDDLAAGDRVAYACTPAGAYTSVRTLSAEHVLRLPAHVDDATAAATLLKGMTAEYCLHRLHRLEPGQTVLVHAAAGALGMLVAQWSRAMGAHVIGTVGSDEKALVAREYCDRVLVARDARFASGVLANTDGRGADLIVDGLGEPAREENLRSIAMTGHWISVGQAGGSWRAVEADWLSSRSVTLSRPVIFHYIAEAGRRRIMAERVFDALRHGHLRPAIRRYALASAADAHRDLEARRTTGQLVLIA